MASASTPVPDPREAVAENAEHAQQNISDGLTVIAGTPEVPPGLPSWREPERDSEMPAAPEDPREAEARAGALGSEEPPQTTQEWLRTMSKARNEAIESELQSLSIVQKQRHESH
mmetsp:Transcript_31970/g.89067  ORF Transcript_31970/g.89067 Transcript_31970/m.89067 type:complete len:115 (+) Transcript_31970:118-462(+)|eukprot:CAMPEP_0176216624 /NCGR_PEP_ID=MMETSP0121_2-20121125/17282_1 /TAXON_ID=160619 /ORGANISM="Kryptoperidinium foliaceum, Strain CCMP 1326" /LENGTH=114 /DNA_ID=CAMNT_0017555747 /DNA_START=110 /DNA_END=454 /DNA_ORIENTATION=+